MGREEFESQVKRLVTGLADQAGLAGYSFFYDGGKLHPDDIAEMATPSILCLAQELSTRLGMKGFGYNFGFGAANPVFPIHGLADNGRSPAFFEVAPFVAEVFEGEVLDCRDDLARLFEAAALVIQPGFSLEANTNHAALATHPAPVDRFFAALER